MTDSLTPERRSWNMSRIKGKNTKPELVLRSLLHQAGFRYRLHPENMPGKPDIVLPRYNTAIFVNGCFWHRHENCRFAYVPKSRPEFWMEKFQSTILRDENKKQLLIADGWHVMIVWECDLKKDPKAVAEKLAAYLGPLERDV
ncbi:MAG: DNA mismatch endonuclease Vsr [Erysipelotrichia bacterium]|nr:DNA mismatch endonuclease Vsr [Erysipelotrichia bacterium]